MTDANNLKKESLAADDVCDRLLSMIIGEQISREVVSNNYIGNGN